MGELETNGMRFPTLQFKQKPVNKEELLIHGRSTDVKGDYFFSGTGVVAGAAAAGVAGAGAAGGVLAAGAAGVDFAGGT